MHHEGTTYNANSSDDHLEKHPHGDKHRWSTGQLNARLCATFNLLQAWSSLNANKMVVTVCNLKCEYS